MVQSRALTGDRSVLHTHLESDSVGACQSNFTQQSLFTGIPPCAVSHICTHTRTFRKVHIFLRPVQLTYVALPLSLSHTPTQNCAYIFMHTDTYMTMSFSLIQKNMCHLILQFTTTSVLCPPVSAGVAQTSLVLQGWPSMLYSHFQSIFFFCVLTGPPGAAAGCQILDYPA